MAPLVRIYIALEGSSPFAVRMPQEYCTPAYLRPAVMAALRTFLDEEEVDGGYIRLRHIISFEHPARPLPISSGCPIADGFGGAVRVDEATVEKLVVCERVRRPLPATEEVGDSRPGSSSVQTGAWSSPGTLTLPVLLQRNLSVTANEGPDRVVLVPGTGRVLRGHFDDIIRHLVLRLPAVALGSMNKSDFLFQQPTDSTAVDLDCRILFRMIGMMQAEGLRGPSVGAGTVPGRELLLDALEAFFERIQQMRTALHQHQQALLQPDWVCARTPSTCPRFLDLAALEMDYGPRIVRSIRRFLLSWVREAAGVSIASSASDRKTEGGSEMDNFLEQRFLPFADSLWKGMGNFIRKGMPRGVGRPMAAAMAGNKETGSIGDAGCCLTAVYQRNSHRLDPVLCRLTNYSSSAAMTVLEEFDRLAPSEVADALTFLDATYYTSLHWSEMLHQAWTKPSRRYQCPNLMRWIGLFNKVSNFVQATVLGLLQRMEPSGLRGSTPGHHRTMASLSERVQRWIDTCRCLRKLRNYASLAAVIAGLNAAPLYRLAFIWGRSSTGAVPNGSNGSATGPLAAVTGGSSAGVPASLLGDFDDYQQLMSFEKNYKRYREILKSDARLSATDEVSRGCGVVPYAGVFLRDLVFAEDGQPTAIDGMLNFTKFVNLHSIIMELLSFQDSWRRSTFFEHHGAAAHAGGDISPGPETAIVRIVQAVALFKPVADAQLMQVSYEIHPRRSAEMSAAGAARTVSAAKSREKTRGRPPP